ncbi:hypothetical protein QFZ81_000088 [Paenibacillus sp. V4I9]|uniref:hypothetical protein n=1 Tax=Paenibacillus sp. V4I9 TaxID=3042308 RepID=UPI0027896587|nr:hypothetical protein [Paenibacillus sp. V4I9]MDQ0885000.1 hypothetical protein [Paenibacillus sp. V4I9]
MNLITVMDQVARKVRIDQEKENSNRSEIIPFRGQSTDIPVIRIPINLPIYRMRNGRTQIEHIMYIQEHGEQEDFFVVGEENQTVQTVQHKMLLGLSKDEKGSIYKELEKVAVQRFSLLITNTGVVVNGNRRIAAMRDLYTKDPGTFSEFEYINVAVLPTETTEEDIELLETELQLIPETKLPYGWLERRWKLRYHVEVLRWSREKVKDTYRFRREDEINAELQQLRLAEEYLNNYLGKPGDYREVRSSEQLFKDLQKALVGKSGDELELRRSLGFLLVKESRSMGDRAYGFKEIFGREFENVLFRYASEESIQLDNTVIDSTQVGNIDEDDPLSDLGTTQKSIFAPLKPIFTNPDQTLEKAEKLARILESVKQGRNEDRAKQLGLINAQNALRSLNDIDLSRCDQSTFEQIKGQLEGIIEKSNQLLLILSTDYEM